MIVGIAFAAFALFGLQHLLRKDVRRLTRPIVTVDAEVIGNEMPSGFWFVEGPTARLSFVYSGREYSVLHTFQTPRQIGTIETLSFPEGHPEDAREPQAYARGVLYALLLLFLGLGVAIANGVV
ncbi:hypothetical protein K3152_11080 [Qipengyuania sp. 1NDH17]|uniref:DUF3592 domain-containing protein n=1 Tax=Qipengyuania polymorpha TaxID=2867234 RepID=A0ABS7J2I9_9SPHN|nr:hypothetical protein [Qipengyuania polymorpha]MBX7458790.1 hypothetical protein [Qipengyuania polymorpha]